MYDNFVPTNPELIVDLRNFYSKANEDPNIIFDYDFVDQTLAFRETNIDEPSCSFICTGRTSYPPINFSEQYFLNMYLYINRKIQGLGFTGKWDSPNVCICGNILVLNLKKTLYIL